MISRFKLWIFSLLAISAVLFFSVSCSHDSIVETESSLTKSMSYKKSDNKVILPEYFDFIGKLII